MVVVADNVQVRHHIVLFLCELGGPFTPFSPLHRNHVHTRGCASKRPPPHREKKTPPSSRFPSPLFFFGGWLGGAFCAQDTKVITERDERNEARRNENNRPPELAP